MNKNYQKCTILHPNNIEKAKNEMNQLDKILQLSMLFKSMSDPTRLEILYALTAAPLCVCDLSNLLEINQSAISHQLRILKQERLVSYRREGKSLLYFIIDSHVNEIFKLGLIHLNEK